jgi:hypothetical protein
VNPEDFDKIPPAIAAFYSLPLFEEPALVQMMSFISDDQAIYSGARGVKKRGLLRRRLQFHALRMSDTRLAYAGSTGRWGIVLMVELEGGSVTRFPDGSWLPVFPKGHRQYLARPLPADVPIPKALL